MQVEQFKIKDIGKPFVKIGDKVVDVSKDAGGKIADTSKVAGGKIADVSKVAGGKIVDTSKIAGGKIVNTGKGIGGIAKNVGGKIAGVAKNIGGVFKSIFTKLWKFLLFLFKNWRIVLSVICGLCILSVVARVASIGRLLGLGRVFSGRAAMRQPMMMSRGGYN